MSSVSPGWPLYKQTSAFSPAVMTSSFDAHGVLNVAKSPEKYALEFSFFKAANLPIEYSLDVVSQPRSPSLSHTWRPSVFCTCSIFQHLACLLDVSLGSGRKNRLCDVGPARLHIGEQEDRCHRQLPRCPWCSHMQWLSPL